ncbi:hypothetical protein PV392_06180 [Streptomyces sp. ME03-5709C]|nr:hypothetical protein [Streptomyces sp. ME03-5709C]
MPRFMDGSVVAMGCLLILGTTAVRRRERGNRAKGEAPGQAPRSHGTWLPLLTGVGMIAAKAPDLLGAPWLLVEIVDAADVALAATVVFLAVRSGRRRVRTRGTT